MTEAPKPTAVKSRGAEWYYPAVQTPTGPKRLIHGERQETRSKAITEARRVLRDAEYEV